jgi:hypothetical protein
VKRARLSPVVVTILATLLAFPVGAGSGVRSKAAPGESAIFYYPWYSTPVRDGRWAHWYVEREGAPVLSTRYFPSRGLYSSSNAKIIAAQMREIAGAGITTVVVSWWGAGSPEDDRLPLVAQAARLHGLEVAVHLEPYHARTPARAAADIARLSVAGISDFYVYDPDRDPTAEWAEALSGLVGVRIFGHTTLVGRAQASGFDGLYTYDVVTWTGSTFRRICTQAHLAGLLCAPSVGPGYDERQDRATAAARGEVRPHVEDSARGERGSRDDHQLQRVARGHPDRTCPGTGRTAGIRRSVGEDRNGCPSCVSRSDGALDRTFSRALASVEGCREPPPVRDRYRIVLPEVVEDRDGQIA